MPYEKDLERIEVLISKMPEEERAKATTLLRKIMSESKQQKERSREMAESISNIHGPRWGGFAENISAQTANLSQVMVLIAHLGGPETLSGYVNQQFSDMIAANTHGASMLLWAHDELARMAGIDIKDAAELLKLGLGASLSKSRGDFVHSINSMVRSELASTRRLAPMQQELSIMLEEQMRRGGS